MDTANANSAASGVGYLQRSNADIVCLQETKVIGGQLHSQERAAKRAKWGLSIEPARVTLAGGLSAGAAVAARSHIGHAVPKDLPWHQEMDTRAKISWIGGICKGGVYVVSLYLWHSEGQPKRNLDLLQHLAWVLKRLVAWTLDHCS